MRCARCGREIKLEKVDNTYRMDGALICTPFKMIRGSRIVVVDFDYRFAPVCEECLGQLIDRMLARIESALGLDVMTSVYVFNDVLLLDKEVIENREPRVEIVSRLISPKLDKNTSISIRITSIHMAVDVDEISAVVQKFTNKIYRVDVFPRTMPRIFAGLERVKLPFYFMGIRLCFTDGATPLFLVSYLPLLDRERSTQEEVHQEGEKAREETAQSQTQEPQQTSETQPS